MRYVEGIVCLCGETVCFGKGEPTQIGCGWARKVVEKDCLPLFNSHQPQSQLILLSRSLLSRIDET